MTSNKSFTEWGSVLGDDVLATTILDRLLHHRRADHQRAQLPTRGPPSPCQQARRPGTIRPSVTDT
ncbi:ATP-binding protein [Rhodococcus sp. 2G]|uniref:ATP-binding protein n=1 Tax=Rhodococcus sp. 2G TaxID=1570939 RepID=UPI0022B44EA8|nr:ATP-binding protein [Rhodococcus sp. 2G]